MENKNISAALRRIELDNAAELEGAPHSHRFSGEFDRRALAVCRGEAPAGRRTRRISLRAALLIAALVCILLAGCAVAVYRYFTRYIPNYGIVDMFSDVRMFATEEELDVGDMKVETVLYIRDGDSGTVRLWASGPALSRGWGDNSWSTTPIFTLKTDNGEYPVLATTASMGTDGGFYECEVQNVGAFDSAALVRDGSEKALAFWDISEKGYTVSAWAEYDGITIKALPLYANNRIIILCTEGIADANYVSATLTVCDSLGNTVNVGSGSEENGWFVLTAGKKLPGEIVKIEIDSLRVRCALPEKAGFEFSVPAADGEYALDGTLLDSDVFTEKATGIRREGDYVYLTTNIDAHKYLPLTDFYVYYDSTDVRIEDQYIVGTYTVVYKLKLGSGTDRIALTAGEYMYMIRDAQNEPLGTIEIQKSR